MKARGIQNILMQDGKAPADKFPARLCEPLECGFRDHQSGYTDCSQVRYLGAGPIEWSRSHVRRVGGL